MPLCSRVIRGVILGISDRVGHSPGTGTPERTREAISEHARGGARGHLEDGASGQPN